MAETAPRILHVLTNHLRSGGSERDVAGAIAWELENGYEVGIATGRLDPNSALPNSVVVHLTPSLRRWPDPYRDARAYRELVQVIDRGRYDIVHTHQSKAGVLGRLAAGGRSPVVAHTVHMASFGPGYSPVGSAVYAAAERLAGRRTDVFVTVSGELGEIYRAAGVGAGAKWFVVRPNLDVDRFARARRLAPEERERLRSDLGIHQALPTLVAIGALDRRKRHALMLRRLAPVLRAGEAQLVLAGEGPEETRLRAIADELGVSSAVHLVGHVTDVPGLLAASDLLVHASRAEGAPAAVLEAFAAGLAVVATDVEGLREIPDAPVTIVDRDGGDFAAAVRDALREPRPALDPSALDQLRPERVQQQHARVHGEFEALLARRRASR